MNWIFRGKQSDDRGVAMASVVLLMIVVMGLSAIMLGLVITQIRPTLVNAKSTRTVAAAQAGLDAAVSQIRGALIEDSSGEVMGDVRQLPCEVKGNVDGSGAPTRFEVKITYYRTDPTNRSRAWRAEPSNQIVCRPTGVPRGLAQVPGYALLTADGFDDEAIAVDGRVNRSVEATYKFSLKTVNTVGGRIYNLLKQHCLVAGDIQVGSRIYYRNASSAACATLTDYNRWVWDKDYMIHLSSSRGALGIDLCITGRSTSESSMPAMTLQACGTDDNVDLGQRFSWRDGGSWEGQNSTNSDYGNFMMQANRETNLDGAHLVASYPFRTWGGAFRAFEPEPTVGAGAASKETNQVVNLLEFGRCLDVFRDKLYMPYSILYPCKQDPSGKERFRWNHRWVYQEPAEGTTTRITTIEVTPRLETNPSGGTPLFSWYGTGASGYINKPFCFLAPTAAGLPAMQSGQPNLPANNTDGVRMRDYWYPRFTDSRIYAGQPESLPSGFGPDCNSARAQWIRTTESGDDFSWTFRPLNNPNMCLSIGPRHHGDQGSDSANPRSRYGGDLWSTVIIEPCDGSKMAQKWNADPNNPGSPLRDFVELSSGS